MSDMMKPNSHNLQVRLTHFPLGATIAAIWNKNPESITCTHEEVSVAMANGYAKIEGKPVLVCVHGTVGTQHATMAVYDAWCDRVPIYLVLGNTQDATERLGEVFWVHSAQDPAAIIRDMTKWDD